MAAYEFQPKALRDTQNIWDYTVDAWSEEQADKYHRMLHSACQQIADNPDLGKQLRWSSPESARLQGRPAHNFLPARLRRQGFDRENPARPDGFEEPNPGVKTAHRAINAIFTEKQPAMTKEKRTATKEEVMGNLLLDLGKLIFGGIILAGIFSSDINKTVLISIGAVVFAAIMYCGVYLLTKK